MDANLKQALFQDKLNKLHQNLRLQSVLRLAIHTMKENYISSKEILHQNEWQIGIQCNLRLSRNKNRVLSFYAPN